MGKISSLPASISIIIVSLDSTLKSAKLRMGPTAAIPGPILLKVANTADRFVSKLNPSKDKISVLITIIIT